MKQLEETRKKALKLLQKHRDEWEPQFEDYANKIELNLKNLQAKRAQFHQWDPLKIYLTLGKAMGQKSKVSFDVRFLGQTVANLIVDDGSGQILLNTTKEQIVSNEKYFKCDIALDKVPWLGKEAQGFQASFKDNPNKPRIKEHRLESLLLTELSKDTGKNKALTDIQPVQFHGIRFPMLTPLKASDHKNLGYSGKGGGIDILTRVEHGGDTTLGIIELKSKNKSAINVACQSVAYTVFIRELLRSKSGKTWWRLFGFENEFPEHLPLKLYAIHAMPSKKNGVNDTSLKKLNIDFKDGQVKDSIVLHYLYFNEVDNEIKSIDSSLTGQAR